MKILILSDIHANLVALEAIEESYDELWVLGDVVSCGPDPQEVIEIVRSRATLAIQGNHDHAVANDDDSMWGEHFYKVATACREATDRQITQDQKAWLRTLPTHLEVERQGTRFYLVHAAPSNPLSGYIPTASDMWKDELKKVDTDILLVGHTHAPFIRELESKLVVNPGSVGFSPGGCASYAIWKDGELSLRSVPYAVHLTVERLRAIGLPRSVAQELANTLLSEGVP